MQFIGVRDRWGTPLRASGHSRDVSRQDHDAYCGTCDVAPVGGHFDFDATFADVPDMNG